MRKSLFLFSILIFTSCTKVEDVIVDGNIVPPDYTIENTTIENYINKLYISTIGREPTEPEFNADYDILRNSNLSLGSRETVINNILNKVEYSFNLFKLESENILNGVDTAQINEYIEIFDFLMQTATGLDSIYILIEYDRLLEMQGILPALINGSINNVEMHKRMVNNLFYDDINMGTENFVVSVFQNFLGRYPSESEVENASTIVDGGNATLFFVAGNGKDDFIDIFFSSDEYFTGQTDVLFNRYLFRNPTSEESVNYSLDYMESEEYKDLQIRILSTNEFIGL
ncbi:MAG: hypothetical protein H8E84_01255 [Flavobacteriales bacterium]|nr:hypothetical protein [Flavobacteriales bacterium]